MDEREESRRLELFEELNETGSIDIRNQLVESYAPLAEFFANRYKRNATDPEDLRQVAQLALVKAVDRFDPSFGVRFSTFAGQTINGELKRYFRDHTWSVRVSRTLQETALEVRNAADAMAVSAGRFPTVQELAERTGYETDVIVQALDVRSAQRANSLDERLGDEPKSATVGNSLGVEDCNFDRTEVKLTMASLLEQLDERDRRIVEMRFYQELTQQEIADELGMSQMHVSRLLRSVLETLRNRYQQR